MSMVSVLYRKFILRSVSMTAKAAPAHEHPNPPGLTGWLKQTMLWLGLVTVLSGGIAWLFSIKEAANEAVRVSTEAKTAADKANVALEQKADKADVQQMKDEIRQDLKDIKLDLRYLRGESTDVTVRHLRPHTMLSNPSTVPKHTP
jgi:hypothetical protein